MRLKKELVSLRDAADARAHFARALFQLELARSGDPEARSAIPAVADALLVFWRDGTGDELAQLHPALQPLWVGAASLLISFEIKRFDKALTDCWAARGDAVRLKMAMEGLQPDDNQRVEFARCLYHLELARQGVEASRGAFARRVGLLSEAYQSQRLADQLVGTDVGLRALWSDVKPYLDEFFEHLEEQAARKQEPTRRVHITDVRPRDEAPPPPPPADEPGVRHLGDPSPSSPGLQALDIGSAVTPTGPQRAIDAAVTPTGPQRAIDAAVTPTGPQRAIDLVTTPTGQQAAVDVVTTPTSPQAAAARPNPYQTRTVELPVIDLTPSRTRSGERPVPSFNALVHHNPALVTPTSTAPQHPKTALAPPPPPVAPPDDSPMLEADVDLGAEPSPPLGEDLPPTPPSGELEIVEAEEAPSPPPPPPAVTPAHGLAAAVEMDMEVDLEEEPDEATLTFWDYTFASLQLAPVEGKKSRMLATETRTDRKRLSTYVDGLSAHAGVPEAKAFGCLVRLLLAGETKEKSLFGQSNPRRQEALTEAFAMLAPTPEAAGKAAVWFELDGRETEEALQRGLELVYPYLAFCSREGLDPAAPETATRYFAR